MVKATSILSHCIAKYQDDENILTNEDYEKLLDEITSDKDLTVGEITICRCAAQTAQLVALDVTVERAFSALRIILTENRNRMNEENLENILLAKLNKSLLDDVIEDVIM
ncbi:hypothetical protein CVS40_9267 [Lucilia cuprina]|nr:hypothetical protein CVS40_9267 [Lucilia cuprina]